MTSPFFSRAGSRPWRAAAVAVCVGAGVFAVGSLAPAEAADRPTAAALQPTAVELKAPGSAFRTAERLALRPSPAPAGKLILPVDPGKDCYLLDNFGDDRGTRDHEGVDIMGSSGRAVYAVADGKLTKRYTNTGSAGWGWTLYVAATNTTYKYYHLTDNPNALVEGDTVAVGDIIGFVGSSGTSGPDNIHLHFEVRPANVAVDPLPLIYVGDTCRVSAPIR